MINFAIIRHEYLKYVDKLNSNAFFKNASMRELNKLELSFIFSFTWKKLNAQTFDKAKTNLCLQYVFI